ncbi:MarR family winged helix-turn-helix transcriptional regulator [Mycobacterium sp. SMC-4]|uniref:MarR family winged helix-turn-helix transcriptional regulator n=1 Tax=Mycobacterium sp. SMC-4 TaxID=2857059 RepID=UPI0021B3AFB6|nr:MarR family winged helix-turn-helix transcriptional regulator [Mycobacterium sp. SMC-4]UXA18533.1 MarR family winged helix-turn-helix transcriptional regulator [Mycobacterium sp. SMC-4]
MDSADREGLEALIAADVRALTAASDRIGHDFAGLHALTANDFRALLHVMVAESAGEPLTAGELSRRLGVSGAAVTYLVERMIASRHLLRGADPADRRKVLLRVADHGTAVARDFFTPLADHTHIALAELPDRDLAAAHRVFGALIDAMVQFRTELEADPQPGGPHRSPGSGRLDRR